MNMDFGLWSCYFSPQILNFPKCSCYILQQPVLILQRTMCKMIQVKSDKNITCSSVFYLTFIQNLLKIEFFSIFAKMKWSLSILFQLD